jgi:hypothetical protein
MRHVKNSVMKCQKGAEKNLFLCLPGPACLERCKLSSAKVSDAAGPPPHQGGTPLDGGQKHERDWHLTTFSVAENLSS